MAIRQSKKDKELITKAVIERLKKAFIIYILQVC